MFRDIKNVLLSGLVGISAISAQANDGFLSTVVPMVNPTSSCLLGEVKIPENMREYSFLSNDDCSAYFVMPPAINKMTFKARPHQINLSRCDEVRDSITDIQDVSDEIRGYNATIARLSLVEPKTPQEQQWINQQIADARENRRLSMADRQALQQQHDEMFDDLEGASFSVRLDSRVLGRDLRTLAQENERIIINNEDNGLPPLVKYSPIFTKAPIAKSLFSFTYYSPKDGHTGGSIRETDIPGLQVLQQGESNYASAHVSVKGNDVLSGKISLRLEAVCGYERKNDEGRYELVEEGNPIFSVNQYYEVQQQFRYGYTASLRTEETVNQMIEEIITSGNQGFRKDQVFHSIMEADLDSVLEFNWSNNFSTPSHAMTNEMIQGIKNNVFAKFVDDYFEKLVQAGKLEIVDPADVDVVNGGYVDVDQVGRRCWIERKWWGRKKRRCENYTYKVKQWRDGLAVKDLQKELVLSGNYVEKVTVNEMVPFYFTTTFN